jgi:3',5'-cyclic AMP phosphodiesterase CpdA
MVTIAHLTDPHIGPLPPARARDLLSKRILGFLSWKLRRSAVHLDEVLGALVRDVHEIAPTHTVVTGDITNIALPEEFVRAARWLESLGSPRDVSIIPGNHDAYVPIPWAESLGLWAEYMAGDGASALGSANDFPYVRERDGVAVIGVSTAVPMAPLLATGAVGRAQLERLERRLSDLGARGLFRIVLIHHPPLRGATHARKRLVDADAFCGVIERAGAELVLHGHTHRSSLMTLDSPRGGVPVIGAPSASASRKVGEHYARYHVYKIAPDAPGARVTVEVRGLDEHTLKFATEHEFELHVPPARGAAEAHA